MSTRRALTIVIGLTVLGVSILGIAWALLDLQVKRVEIYGERRFVSDSEVRESLDERLKGQSYWALSIADIKEALETHIWIEQANVSRIRGQAFRVEITEHVPIAFWNESAFLSRSGEVFDTMGRGLDLSLPKLSGPEVLLSKLVDEYRVFNEALRTHGIEVAQLRASADGQRTIFLNIDVQIRLGTYNIEDKILRFASLWNTLSEEQRARVMRIDMRYDNAAAIAWRDASED